MPKAGEKSTGKSAEAGARNLSKWKAENPSGGNIRHGAWSKHFRKRYSDGRTSQGKQLAAFRQGLVADVGGNSVISVGQRLIVDRLCEKYVVLNQIGLYIDKQDSLINDQGELLTCLSRNYTSFSESFRRDLVVLYGLSVKKPARVPTLDDWIETQNKEKDNNEKN